MIVVAYPGVGKTFTTENYENYIDLDSSEYKNNELWEVHYVRKAIDLSRKGFTVFISCHKAVTALLKDCKEKVVVVYPSLLLQQFWVAKLKNRWKKDKENYAYHKALYRATSHYCEDILELSELPFPKIEIKVAGYNLHELLKTI